MTATQSVMQKKICMLGGFSVGKTSLVKRYEESVFSETYLTTVGVKIDKKVVALGERPVNLILWDLAGENDLEELRRDGWWVRPSSARTGEGVEEAFTDLAQRVTR